MKILKKIYNKFPNRLKNIIRNNFIKKRNLTKDSFEKKLLKYDIISFDIFDTLISRLVYEPDDIFRLMEQKIENIKLKDTFYNMRKNAERSARENLHKDVNLDEIYSEFCKIYGYDKRIVNDLKKLEIDLELCLTLPRKDMLDVLKKLMNSQKQVVLTSDMYLTKNVIIEMLRRCGFIQGVHFNEIYLSNDKNMRKDDETMWKFLKDKYKGKKFIHIGDNINSDYNIPIKLGLKAVNIANPRLKFEQTMYYNGLKKNISERTISDSLFLGYIINEQIFNSPFSVGVDSLEKLSKTFIAPMILELIKFVDEKTTFDHKLLFLSREGYYLEKLYVDYCKIFNIKEKSHYYFLASRKATMSSTIENDNDLKSIVNRNYIGSICSFLKSVFDVDYTGNDYNIELPNDFDKVYKVVKELKKDIIEKSKLYKENYLKYIDSLVNYKKDNLIIIDLGYSGTIQYHLSKMLEKDLKGIYLNNTNSVKKYSKNSELLFSFDINKNSLFEKIYHYSLILEYFLSAPFGQLQYFSKQNNEIMPVYNNEQMDDNKKNNILQIYEYVREYIKRYKEINEIYKLDISKELLCLNYIFIVESNIITKDVKDNFNFVDSFSTDEIKNIFKIISRY